MFTTSCEGKGYSFVVTLIPFFLCLKIIHEAQHLIMLTVKLSKRLALSPCWYQGVQSQDQFRIYLWDLSQFLKFETFLCGCNQFR